MRAVNLSKSEWSLMNALWEHAPCTITGLVELFSGETGWSKHTIISMLNRLEAKGAVRHEEGSRAKQFYPAIDRADTRRQETRSFLSKLYGGSLGLMMSALVDSRALTQEDIDQLSAILEQAKEESS